MSVGKFISIALLLFLALLLYRAEEHFEHLLAVMKDELDHQHYNQMSTTHPDHLAVNWMSDLDDNLLISNITIPGSHNTGTYACHQLCIINQCQGWRVKDQLRAGLRYLDFRLDDQKPLNIYHGPFKVTQFSPMLGDVSEFLRQNPSEFVFVSFQHQFGKIDPYPYIMQQIQKHKVPAVFTTKIPTVGEMRGKIFVVAGVGVFMPETYRIEGYFGIWDLPTAYIQNMFMLFPWDVKYKKSIIEDGHLTPCSPNRFKINYWTGAFAVLPYMFAKMGKGPNRTFYDWLKANRGQKCIGINMMDYPSHKLIKQLFMTNFPQTDF